MASDASPAVAPAVVEEERAQEASLQASLGRLQEIHVAVSFLNLSPALLESDFDAYKATSFVISATPFLALSAQSNLQTLCLNLPSSILNSPMLQRERGGIYRDLYT